VLRMRLGVMIDPECYNYASETAQVPGSRRLQLRHCAKDQQGTLSPEGE